METNDSTAAAPPPPAPIAIAAPAPFDAVKFGLAAAAGLGAAVAGAALWAVVTVVTNYEIGIMAVAVGFLVGRSIIFVAKSGNVTYGVLGAALALFGCLLGNLLSAVGFAAPVMGMTYFELLTHLDFKLAGMLMQDTFGAMDLLFYGIGIYEGFRFASRR